LLLPAEHVIATFISPIKPLPSVVHSWRHPPPVVDSHHYLRQADAAILQGDLDLALHEVENAMKLDRRAAGPYVRLAAIFLRRGQTQLAQQSADIAVELEPRSPDGLYIRGVIEQRRGDFDAARRDLSAALGSAKSDWPARTACEQDLAKLNGQRPR